ncbi:MAG: hypothetical protein AB1807_06275 [Pseudomonadota bacterium]
MKQFDLVAMASGGRALVLEPSAEWSEFSALAEKWLGLLPVRSHSAPVITHNECLVAVDIDGGSFWITYDDWQGGIHLEPQEPAFNDIVARLQRALKDGAR